MTPAPPHPDASPATLTLRKTGYAVFGWFRLVVGGPAGLGLTIVPESASEPVARLGALRGARS